MSIKSESEAQFGSVDSAAWGEYIWADCARLRQQQGWALQPDGDDAVLGHVRARALAVLILRGQCGNGGNS